MKRIMVLVLAMVLTLSLCACKTTEEVVSEYSEENTTISTSSDSGEADTDVGNATNTAKKTTAAGTIKKTAVRVTTTAPVKTQAAPIGTGKTRATRATRFPGHMYSINIRDFAGEIADILFASSGMYIITTDGSFYELSDKLFSSTNTNYQKIDLPIKCKRFMLSPFAYVILGEDNKLYSFSTRDKNISPCDLTYPDKNPYHTIEAKTIEELKEYTGDYANVLTCEYSAGEKQGTTNCVIKGNAIYLMGNDTPQWKVPSDEKIELVLDGTIKTDKRWYALKTVVTNEEESEKYADVDPIYETVLTPIEPPMGALFYKNQLGNSFVDKDGYVGSFY